MRVLYILLRLVLFYVLFRFLFRAVSLLVRLSRRPANRRDKETVININKEHPESNNKKTFDYKDIVDAEFKEME